MGKKSSAGAPSAASPPDPAANPCPDQSVPSVFCMTCFCCCVPGGGGGGCNVVGESGMHMPLPTMAASFMWPLVSHCSPGTPRREGRGWEPSTSNGHWTLGVQHGICGAWGPSLVPSTTHWRTTKRVGAVVAGKVVDFEEADAHRPWERNTHSPDNEPKTHAAMWVLVGGVRERKNFGDERKPPRALELVVLFLQSWPPLRPDLQ